MAHKTKFVEVIELYIKSLKIRSVLFQRGRRVLDECKHGIWYFCVEAHRVIVGENWEGIIEFSCILLLWFPLTPFIWGGATLVWPASTYILFVTFHYWHTNGKKLLNLCVYNLSWQHDNSPLHHSRPWFTKMQK